GVLPAQRRRSSPRRQRYSARLRSAWKRSTSTPWRAKAKEQRAFSSSPKFWLVLCDSTDLAKRSSTRARLSGHRHESGEIGERGAGRRFIFLRHFRAIDPSRTKAEGRRAHHVPAIRRNENGLARRDLEVLGDERIDLGARLVDADRVDRENGIEVASDVGRLDRGGEHLRRAIR